MPFKSTQPDINFPRNGTTWTWLFDSPASLFSQHPTSALAGYTDASTGARVSYADVKTHTTHLSTALVKKYGLKKGDTVALFSPNTIWYPVAMLGVSRVGGVVSGASPAYNVEEMTYALKTAKAKFLFTVEGSMGVAAEAAKAAGIGRERVFLLQGEMEGFATMKELLDIGKREREQVSAYRLGKGETNGELCGFLSFSSGTTGLPKAVMISHQNVIAQCLQVQQISPPGRDKVLAVLPSFHITGLVHSLHLPILLNAEVYMQPAFTMKSMLDTVTRYKIDELLLVPPILIRMVRRITFLLAHRSGTEGIKNVSRLLRHYPSAPRLRNSPKSLTNLSTGTRSNSRRIRLKLRHEVQQRRRAAQRRNYDFATEEIPQYWLQARVRHDGVMLLHYCSSTRKVRELGIGEPGELLARGPQITMGYLGNEKATKSTYDEEGYLHTGDQAVIDAEGMVTITDRIKEMIKVKGIAVAPAELEDLLLGHSHVEDCAVLGIRDEYSGEKPKAFIVKKPGSPAERELGGELI
ncbi:4-coumarate--CoA ligase-like, partial [Lachnellula suecica]